MKNLRIQLTDSLHQRLKNLCTHHGELSHLVRRAVRQLVTQMEEAKHGKAESLPSTKLED